MLQANQRQTPLDGLRRPARQVRGWIFVALMLLLVLAGCADDSGDRQFANDPRTPSPTKDIEVATPAAEPAASPIPLASPETLVERRGSPSVFYAELEGTLWAFDGSDQTAVTNGPIPAFAASPDGERVAVVTRDESDTEISYGIDVYASDGERVDRLDGVLTVPAGGATPLPLSESDDSVSLSWAPDGERLLLSHASGHLVDVPLDGEAKAIETRAPLTGIAMATWSPAGDIIGAVIRNEDGNGSLALLDLAEEPARVNVVAPIGREKSVESFSWNPHGDGVLFLEGRRGEDGLTGGTLVSWDRATNATRIVATGGQAGPTGSIAWFSLAPDGKAVAYGIDMLTGSGWSFNGLFVRSLESGQVYRVPISGNNRVLSAWWLDGGLTWASVGSDPEGEDAVTVMFVDGTGERSRIGEVSETDLATPAASPMAATPAATPVASPVPATPVEATPQATPME